MERDPEVPTGVARARSLARVLDAAVGIPGTRVRFGLDSVLGLVPGLGDLAGAVLAGYVVVLAARLGAPASVITRMLGNVAVDTLVGTVPVVGDAFDVGWKSNLRNVALLEGFLGQPDRTRRSSRAMVVGVVVALALLAALGVVAVVFVVRAVMAAAR